jgi:hypothetical protein
MSFVAKTVKFSPEDHGEVYDWSNGRSTLYAVMNYIDDDQSRRLPVSENVPTAENGYMVSQSLLSSSFTTGIDEVPTAPNSVAMSSTSFPKPGAPSAAATCREYSCVVIYIPS